MQVITYFLLFYHSVKHFESLLCFTNKLELVRDTLRRGGGGRLVTLLDTAVECRSRAVLYF